MTIEEVRKLFPHLQTGQIYFNHAALGPWHQKVTDRLNEYVRERTGTNVMNYESFVKFNDSAKRKLCELIGTKAERISWIDNVSNAMNIVAQGLEWKAGDRVVLNDIEFPANVYPFLNLKKQGVEIDIVKSRNGIVDLEDIEKVITPRTKLVTISLVQFLSGYRADVTAIGEMCKKHNIIFCVDAIQATGVVQIDVEKSNIDFLCGGSHKWLMSCEGLSYFYIKEELQTKINQKFVGWTSVKNAWNFLDYKLELRDDADRFQNGTLNALGICLFDASLDLFIESGIISQPKDFELRILENSEYFINKLFLIGIEPLLKNIPQEHLSGIVSFKHEKAKQVFKILAEKNIHCAVREGIIRLSPHFYNTKDEIDEVISILKEVNDKSIH